MAGTINRVLVPDLGTTYGAAEYTASSVDASVNEVRVMNKSGSNRTIDVELYPLGASGNNVVLLPTRTVQAGASLVFKGFRAMLSSDELHLKTDAGSAIDVLISVLEQDTATSNIHQGYVQSIDHTALETLFTATADLGINDLTFTNTNGADATVDMELWPLGVSGNKITFPTVTVPAGDIWEYIGVIDLLDTDVLKVQTDTNGGVDAILSGVSTT